MRTSEVACDAPGVASRSKRANSALSARNTTTHSLTASMPETMDALSPQPTAVATSEDLRGAANAVVDAYNWQDVATRLLASSEATAAVEQDPELPHLIAESLHVGNPSEQKITRALISLCPQLAYLPTSTPQQETQKP